MSIYKKYQPLIDKFLQGEDYLEKRVYNELKNYRVSFLALLSNTSEDTQSLFDVQFGASSSVKAIEIFFCFVEQQPDEQKKEIDMQVIQEIVNNANLNELSYEELQRICNELFDEFYELVVIFANIDSELRIELLLSSLEKLKNIYAGDNKILTLIDRVKTSLTSDDVEVFKTSMNNLKSVFQNIKF